MSRAKLKDIAARAGVSMMTVSRVMNNHPKVGEATRAKVKQIAQEMNYLPNMAARTLASAKSFFIGIICEYANASYVSKFLVGALRSGRKTGFHMLIDETTGDKEKAADIIHELVNVMRVDGLILLPPVSNDPDIITLLEDTKIPFIRIAPDIQLEASPYICMDDYQAAYAVTEKLIKSGHQRIAHIKGHPDQGVSEQRYKGYLDALQAHGHQAFSECVEQGYFTYRSGLEAANRLLTQSVLPDAIFVANDEMAAGVVATAHRLHLDVPDQVSVVGFDDTEIANTIWPTLSTVQQPLHEMAELAIQLISKPPSQALKNKGKYLLNYQICQRGSSKSVD